MFVEDLVKELEKLPKGSTIGMIDINDTRLIEHISIKTKNDVVYDYTGNEIKIGKIENGRRQIKVKYVIII